MYRINLSICSYVMPYWHMHANHQLLTNEMKSSLKAFKQFINFPINVHKYIFDKLLKLSWTIKEKFFMKNYLHNLKYKFSFA